MAKVTSFASELHPSEFLSKKNAAPISSNDYLASDEEIPTVDYSLLFSDDPNDKLLALENLRHACEEYGFFYLVNHTIQYEVFDSILNGVSDFFDPKTIDERRIYCKKGPLDKIRWDFNSNDGENREYLKVIAHPYDLVPSNQTSLSKIGEEYCKEMRSIVGGLARAISTNLGFDENYIEKSFNMKSGFDVMAMNLYPPNSRAKGNIGIPEHTDPGFVVTLVQDVNGGLQILSHNGRWINVYIPPHAILIQLGDHLEILTNGKYKSHIHRVIVNNNKVQRTSIVTLHGPSLDEYIIPSSEFVDEDHPQKYRGMTYKESLEANGGDDIDVESSLEQLRLM